jgi:hypothetical protein
MLIGLGTAYISKVKQQRRQLSNTSLLIGHPDAETDLHLRRSIPEPVALRAGVIVRVSSKSEKAFDRDHRVLFR